MPGVKFNEIQRKALLEIIKKGRLALGVNPSTGAALVRRGLVDRHLQVFGGLVMLDMPYVYTATLAGRVAAKRDR